MDMYVYIIRQLVFYRKSAMVELMEAMDLVKSGSLHTAGYLLSSTHCRFP